MPNENMGNRAMPQPPDVATGVIVATVVGFVGFVALTMAGLFFYLKADAPHALQQAIAHRFPEPVLQQSPQDDLERFESRATHGAVGLCLDRSLERRGAHSDRSGDADDRRPRRSRLRSARNSPQQARQEFSHERRAALLLALALWPAGAQAGLTEAQLAEVALYPAGRGASLRSISPSRTSTDTHVTLRDAIGGRPTLLIPADFTCTQICGPALSIATSALSQTGLLAGRDYSLVVIGIDAKDSAADARQFASGQVGGPGISVLSGSERGDTIADDRNRLPLPTRRQQRCDRPSRGLRDAHRGRPVSRVLSSLALQPTDLRLALVEAGRGTIGGLAGRIALLCYGFDAVHGVYTREIATMLRLGGGMTVAILASALGLMLWRSAKRGASA